MEGRVRVLKTAGVFAKDALKVYGIYLVVVVLGTGVLMFLADSIGFLSYSDRPGPGWYGFHPHISIADLQFLFGFVVTTTIFSALFLLIPCTVLLTVALRRLRVNVVIAALMLVPSYAYATLELFAGAGWYIAISDIFVLIAAALSIPFAIAMSTSNGIRIGRLRL